MKFLIWAVLAYFVVSWVMRSRRTSKRTNDAPPGADNAEPIVQCVQCGVHVPASEAIIGQSGVIFCSEAHRLQKTKS